MRKVLAAEYGQRLLLAPAIEDRAEARDPARFIREFVGACAGSQCVVAVQAVDGSKIAAVSSRRGGFYRERLEKLPKRLDGQIAEQEKDVERARAPGSEAALARVTAEESKHAHPLKSSATRMNCDGHNRWGSKAQAVVDAEAQLGRRWRRCPATWRSLPR